MTLDWLRGVTRPAHLANVGCGSGVFNEMAVDAGFVVAGYEPDPAAYALALRRLPARDCTLQPKGLQEIGSDEAADVVVMHDVLEHIEDERSAVESLRSIVKDDGRVIVSVPAMPSLFGLHDEMLGHFRRYTRATLRRALEPCFRITRLRSFGCTFIPLTLYYSRWRRRPYPLERAGDDDLTARLRALHLCGGTAAAAPRGHVARVRGTPTGVTVATSIAVIGLWHLGSVTSACLASLGHRVTAYDPDPGIVAQLSSMDPPVAEPGLVELLEQAVAAGRLRFATDRADAVRSAEVVWVTFDTPVDDDDRADVDAVLHEIQLLIPHLGDGATVLLSSQLPVGTAQRVEHALRVARPEDHIGVACSPENLRLGQAIESFLGAPRIVVGARR